MVVIDYFRYKIDTFSIYHKIFYKSQGIIQSNCMYKQGVPFDKCASQYFDYNVFAIQSFNMIVFLEDASSRSLQQLFEDLFL